MPAYPAFVGGSYPASAYSADTERTINFFVEPHQAAGAKARSSLIGTPGFQAWSAGGASASGDHARPARPVWLISVSSIESRVVNAREDASNARW